MEQDKTIITLIGKTGLKFQHRSKYTLEQLIRDAFLTAEYQDENWDDDDTMRLIIKKLKGQSPIEHIWIEL